MLLQTNGQPPRGTLAFSPRIDDYTDRVTCLIAHDVQAFFQILQRDDLRDRFGQIQSPGLDEFSKQEDVHYFVAQVSYGLTALDAKIVQASAVEFLA